MTSREVTVKAAPGSPEWLQLITASKIPSILGISRFKSQFSLWHEMAGNVETEPISKAQQDDFDYGTLPSWRLPSTGDSRIRLGRLAR